MFSGEEMSTYRSNCPTCGQERNAVENHYCESKNAREKRERVERYFRGVSKDEKAATNQNGNIDKKP
jgi:hypothetical protein